MEFLPVVFFFLYSWGIGFSVLSFVKQSDNFLERNALRIGFGIACTPIIGIIFSYLGIPVDWGIFLALSLAYPLYWIFRNMKSLNFKPSLKLTKSGIAFLAVIAIFAISLNMYYKGSLAYPYLEDDDSWAHALGAKYVAVEKTFFNPYGRIHYLDPYPPAYDGIIGIVHQTSGSLMWTLKFFNALLVSLSLIFFYLFMKEFSGNMALAALSTAILAMIPAFLSHFIWAHSIVPLFIFISFCSLERISHDKKWMYAAALPMAALLLSTVTQGLKFGFLFLVYFAAKSMIERKFAVELFISAASAFIISSLWWVHLLSRYGGMLGLLKSLGLSQDELAFSLEHFSNPLLYIGALLVLAAILGFAYLIWKRMSQLQKSVAGVSAAMLILVSYGIVYSTIYGVGTADRIYDFNDFFMAKSQNMINNPVGIGIAAMMLLFIALFLIAYEIFSAMKEKKSEFSKKTHMLLTALWWAILFSAVSSLVSFASFRLRPGTFLKQWMLTYGQNHEANFAYVYSFSFKVWGVYLFIFSLIALSALYIFLIYRGMIQKRKLWLPVTVLWFTYAFSGIYDIPIQFFTFRLWMLVAIPISMLAAYSTLSVSSITKKTGMPKIIVWAAILAAVFYTSAVQKYSVNNAVWPPGGFWTSNDEISGYLWFKDSIPAETKTFTFSNNALVIGFDKFICSWCPDVSSYQSVGFNQTAQQNSDWLRKNQYKYLIIDGQAARRHGINLTNNKISELANSGLFRPAYQTGSFIIMQAS